MSAGKSHFGTPNLLLSGSVSFSHTPTWLFSCSRFQWKELGNLESTLSRGQIRTEALSCSIYRQNEGSLVDLSDGQTSPDFVDIGIATYQAAMDRSFDDGWMARGGNI